MASKKKKIGKALKTLIPLLGIGAVMAGRGRKSMPVDPDVVVSAMNMDQGQDFPFHLDPYSWWNNNCLDVYRHVIFCLYP